MATTVTDSFQQPAQIDYLLRSVLAPRYKMRKIPLNNLPSASATIEPTSSTMLEWKLPNIVYNLYRSYISYNLNAPAVALKVSTTHEDVFDLGQTVTFGSAGGVDLVNLQFAQNYTKIARKIATPIDDFLGNDDMSGLYKSNMTNGYPITSAAAPADSTSANFVPGGYNKVVGASYIAPDNVTESRYCQFGGGALLAPGVLPKPAVGTVLDRYRQYPLSAFTGTLLGVDRDFYSPTEQYLRVLAGFGDKMGFATTALTDPPTGAQSIPGITINSVYLYLAVEDNQDIVQKMITAYGKGELQYRIPYTTAFKNVGSANGQQTNISIQLSQQYGKRLKRILHTVFNKQEKWNTAYDCANWDGEKITSYQTFMDSIPIQDRQLSCARPSGISVNQDDWLENKKFLDRKSAYLSKEMYGINWFHIDQFFEPRDKDGSLPEVNLDEGLPMDQAKQWVFSGQVNNNVSAAGLLHYTYAEFSREILITNQGPIYV
jgi:hypothetical protein